MYSTMGSSEMQEGKRKATALVAHQHTVRHPERVSASTMVVGRASEGSGDTQKAPHRDWILRSPAERWRELPQAA